MLCPPWLPPLYWAELSAGDEGSPFLGELERCAGGTRDDQPTSVLTAREAPPHRLLGRALLERGGADQTRLVQPANDIGDRKIRARQLVNPHRAQLAFGLIEGEARHAQRL